MMFHRTNGEISWSCDSCGDEGVITGWEQSPTDGSGLDDSYVEGDVVAVLVDRDLADVLRGVPLLDAACELVIARAEGRSDGVLLTGRAGAFEELLEYVAAESNAEPGRRRQRQLDRAFEALESVLAEG